MFEQLGFENLNPTQASLILALILGLLFGAIAQHLKFCLEALLWAQETALKQRAASGLSPWEQPCSARSF